MGGLTKKATLFLVLSSHSKTALKFFYEIEIIRFSANNTEWPYPKEHCWKRLSDCNKIRFYQNIYTNVKGKDWTKI